jgi:flavin-dependent thymidylate synthase
VYYTEPRITVLSRPQFTEPAGLPVNWIGDSTDGERLAEFAGRLCYMSQRNPASRSTREYLENIKKQGHGSVLEHANYSLLVEGVSRSLTHELVRHRAGMAYCLAGDTLIYSEHMASGHRSGPTKRPIKDLYEMTLTPHGRSRLKLLRLRCLDESTQTFTTGRVKAVVASGIKPVFKVTLADGKSITCTKEHRFLTPSGWQSLDEIVGTVTISAGGMAVVGNLGGSICVNGTPAYKDADWLRSRYHDDRLEQHEIAELAGVSTHTIRSWVRRHKLQKAAGAWSVGRAPWNKGTRYTAGWHHNEATLAQLSEAKRGERNHNWRGGTTRRAVMLRKQAHALRSTVLKRDDYCCRLCGCASTKLTLHHVLPIWARPDLVADIDNLASVCRSCHFSINGKELDYVEHFGRSREEVAAGARAPLGKPRTLTPRTTTVASVVYAGEMETYDIEMAGSHHNFVANGVVTHNSQLSQRYVDESEANFVVPPAIIGDESLRNAWQMQIDGAQTAYIALVEQLMERYSWVPDRVHRRKMAREAARGVLPNSTETKIVITGNARAWRTLLELRSSEGAELEIRRWAVMVIRVLQNEAPGFFSDFEIYQADDRREAARVTYHKV